MATVRIYVEDVNARMDEGYDSIKLYRDTDPSVLDNTSTLVTTITLVEDQENYDYEDPAGDSTSWYGFTLYDNTGPVESTISLKWRAIDSSLQTLLLETARRCNLGFAGTCSGDGGLSTLTDEVLRDFGVDANYGAGWWLWWYSAAAAADRVPRRVSEDGFVAGAGSWTVNRAWSAAPQEGDGYHVYGMLPPVDLAGSPWSWQRAINEGLQYCRWTDALNLGDGTGRQDTFSLRQHLGYLNPDKDIRRVRVRHTIDADLGLYAWVDYDTNGRYWERQRGDGSDYSVRLYPAPPADCTVFVEVNRRGDSLYALTDTTTCPMEQVIEAAAWRMYEWLAANGRGEYATQAKSHKDAFDLRRRQYGVTGALLV